MSATLLGPAPVATSPAGTARAASATPTRSLVQLMHETQTLHSAGRADDAVSAYRDWINGGTQPMRHVACFNLGTLLGSLGRSGEAEAAYRQALAIHADFPHARLNLGHLLERGGDHEAALAEWRAVLAGTGAKDLRVHAFNNLGRLLETLRRFPEAEHCLAESLKLDAEQPHVVQHYVHLRQKQCKWPAWQGVGELTPN